MTIESSQNTNLCSSRFQFLNDTELFLNDQDHNSLYHFRYEQGMDMERLSNTIQNPQRFATSDVPYSTNKKMVEH